MNSSPTNTLGHQLKVVLLSYLTRPGFRWGIVGAGSGFGLYYLATALSGRIGGFDATSIWFLELILMVATLVIYASAVGMLIIYFWHARQQLMGPQARLLPHTRSANAIVAGALLIGLVLLIASPSIADTHLHFFGVFIVVLAFLTLIAWAFCNPWLAPIPAILMVMASRNIYVYRRSWRSRALSI